MKVKGVKYVPNHRSMGEYMQTMAFGLRASEMAAEIATLTNAITAKYSAKSTDGDADVLSGSYKTRRIVWRTKAGSNPRTASEVYSKARSAPGNEFGGGSGENRRTARAPLRKAASAIAAKSKGPA